MSLTDLHPTGWRPGHITIVGNPGLDTLVVLAEDDPDLEADGHFVHNVDTVGHAAAFTARACSRLGHHTRILGSTGSDVIGGLVRGVGRARGLGLPVAVDLQDVRDPADPYRAGFIASADYLFASAAHLEDPVAAASSWFAAGPAALVVFGVGPRGALLVQRAGSGPPIVTHEPPPELDLPIVDTTGAGDGLATGFLDGLLFGGLSAAEALHRGQALARIVASGLGGDAPFDRAGLDALTAH